MHASPFYLNNTISEDSPDKIIAAHAELQTQYPHHISFNTAQHSDFLAYSLIAANVLKKFRPGQYSDCYLQNIHILRYPCGNPPKSLKELFQLFPMRQDYDTAFSLVADVLISVSPSLSERESQESAWAIFEKNEREGDVASYIYQFLESEKISPVHFRERIRAVVEEAPKSNEGLIYTFFIPKDAPLCKAIYLSEGYGIPIGDPLSGNQLLDFYEQYGQGLVEEKNTQLRFLPSALIPENNFDLSEIKSYRFTTIPLEQLNDYARKIETVVDDIFKDHLEEMLELAALASEVEAQLNPIERQNGYQKLCYRHLCRRDVQLALYYWHKIHDQIPHKFSYLPGIIACLLRNNQLSEAEHYFQRYEEKLIHKEQLITRFAVIYLEQDNRPMLDQMIKKLADSGVKQFVMVLAVSHYPEYAQEYIPGDIENPMSDDALIDLAAVLEQNANVLSEQ